MDSPSFGSASLPILDDPPTPAAPAAVDRPTPTPTPTTPAAPARPDLVAVAGFGAALGVAADYADWAARDSRGGAALIVDGAARAPGAAGLRTIAAADWARGDFEPTGLVVFLPDRPSDRDRSALAGLLDAAGRRPVGFVALVGSFRVHLDDPAAEAAERSAADLARSRLPGARLAIFRPGVVLSPNSRASRWARRLAPLAALAPDRLRTCLIDGPELFAAIDSARAEGEASASASAAGVEADRALPGRPVGRRHRAYTMLGENRPWRRVFEEHRRPSAGGRLASAAASALSWLLVGQLVAIVVEILSRATAGARTWVVATIRPRSFGEVVSLCHAGNLVRVRVVGYNNGVNHFGHRYPGRTIVATGRLHRVRRAGPGLIRADCGATIRDARDALHDRGEELYVVPNYSYVAIGTSFFVPIHGSAVDYSTVADTATRVLLYDPESDRIVSAGRSDAAFRENVYNPRSHAVVLRLTLRSKPKSRYFVRREVRRHAPAGELMAALRDREAANVEIRQGSAASPDASISKYYTSPGDPSEPALESPRDALGRLWDRLEENPVTSFLMHATSRHLAWHTELFLTAAEFDVFWRTHAEVPLRKIQLRYIGRDGMPHSPFRDEGCVSADLFLFRPSKAAFDAYMRRHLPKVRANPGKHSN